MGRQVRRHTPPVLDAARAGLGSVDHVDAVAVDLPAGTSAVDFARLVLAGGPRWIGRLTALRDRLAAPFGLHVQERDRPHRDIRLKPGLKIGPMRVLVVADDEVLCGDDDKHLDFRASFAVRPTTGPTGTEGVLTTAVRFNRPAGRLYFRAIEPFHHLIVARLVAHAGRPRP
ncbi:DUF2867 domain-containing protein [Streptomyces sp. NPDC058611]|uniref:DUF2867 domain-containing protein n=1 Tax=unclassified Streptomyces TaxID=2593676 RepID=UPI0036639959